MVDEDVWAVSFEEEEETMESFEAAEGRRFIC